MGRKEKWLSCTISLSHNALAAGRVIDGVVVNVVCVCVCVCVCVSLSLSLLKHSVQFVFCGEQHILSSSKVVYVIVLEFTILISALELV